MESGKRLPRLTFKPEDFVFDDSPLPRCGLLKKKLFQDDSISQTTNKKHDFKRSPSEKQKTGFKQDFYRKNYTLAAIPSTSQNISKSRFTLTANTGLTKTMQCDTENFPFPSKTSRQDNTDSNRIWPQPPKLTLSWRPEDFLDSPPKKSKKTLKTVPVRRHESSFKPKPTLKKDNVHFKAINKMLPTKHVPVHKNDVLKESNKNSFLIKSNAQNGKQNTTIGPKSLKLNSTSKNLLESGKRLTRLTLKPEDFVFDDSPLPRCGLLKKKLFQDDSISQTMNKKHDFKRSPSKKQKTDFKQDFYRKNYTLATITSTSQNIDKSGFTLTANTGLTKTVQCDKENFPFPSKTSRQDNTDSNRNWPQPPKLSLFWRPEDFLDSPPKTSKKTLKTAPVRRHESSFKPKPTLKKDNDHFKATNKMLPTKNVPARKNDVLKESNKNSFLIKSNAQNRKQNAMIGPKSLKFNSSSKNLLESGKRLTRLTWKPEDFEDSPIKNKNRPTVTSILKKCTKRRRSSIILKKKLTRLPIIHSKIKNDAEVKTTLKKIDPKTSNFTKRVPTVSNAKSKNEGRKSDGIANKKTTRRVSSKKSPDWSIKKVVKSPLPSTDICFKTPIKNASTGISGLTNYFSRRLESSKKHFRNLPRERILPCPPTPDKEFLELEKQYENRFS